MGVARVAGLAALLLLFSLSGAVAEQRSTEVYQAVNRTAGELLPLAESAMGEEGSATLDAGTNSIVLTGSPSVVEQALSLLRQQDRRRRTVVMRYVSKRVDELAADGVRVDWSASVGGIRVGNAIFPRDAAGARASGRVFQSHREGDLAGTLRVLDGEVGHVGTGETVPVRDRGIYTSSLAFVTAEQGFTARPRILAEDRVQVEIAASDERLARSGEASIGGEIDRVIVSPDETARRRRIHDPTWVEIGPGEEAVDRDGRVQFTEATTTVIVKPGETLAVGGISRATDEYGEGSRVNIASQRAWRERVFLLTVDVE
jgi:hypothetical protein